MNSILGAPRETLMQNKGNYANRGFINHYQKATKYRRREHQYIRNFVYMYLD